MIFIQISVLQLKYILFRFQYNFSFESYKMKQKINISPDGFAIMPSDIKKKKRTNAT